MGTSVSKEDVSSESISFRTRMEKGWRLSSEIGSGWATLKRDQSSRKNFARIKSTLTEKEAKRRFKEGMKSSLLFKGIREELSDALFSVAVPVFAKKGQVIFERGSTGQIMFVVVRGGVKATKLLGGKRSKKHDKDTSEKDMNESLLRLVNNAEKDEIDLNAFDVDTWFGVDEEGLDDIDGEYEESDTLRPHLTRRQESRKEPGHEPQQLRRELSSGKYSDSTASSSATDTAEKIEDKDYKLGSASLFPRLSRQTSTSQLRPGRVLGSHCLLLNVPHTWTLTATKDSLLLAVHRLQFQEISTRISQRNRLLESTERRMEWLQRFAFLCELEDQQLNWLADKVVHKKFAPGDLILEQGERLNGLFIVLRGTIAYKRPKMYAMEYRSKEEEEHWRDEKELQEELNQIAWFSQGDGFGGGLFLLAREDACDVRPVLGVDLVAGNYEPVECLVLDWDTISPFRESGDKLPLGKALQIANWYANDLFQSSSLFSSLGSDEIANLVDRMQLQVYEDGETILTRGDEADRALYIILFGTVSMEGVILAKTSRKHRSEKPRADVMKKLFGRQSVKAPNLKKGTSLHRGLSQQSLNTAALSATSDESAELLDGNIPFVLLVEGESFGEEGIEFEVDLQTVSCTAVGTAICARISVELLEELGYVDRVRHAYYGDSLPNREQARSVVGGGELVQRKREQFNKKGKNNRSSLELVESFSMSSTFLLLHDMLEFGESSDGSFRPGRMSLARTINKNTLKVLEALHETTTTKVFLALHEPTNQLVVVKKTNLIKSNQEGMGRYAFTEQSILSQVNSQFVVRLLSAWEDSACHIFVAIEPVLGGKLDAYISQRRMDKARCGPLGCLQLREIRFFSACLVLALKHLGESNICHRDLKTVNIMLDHHGYVKVADFGISKQLQHRSSRTSTFVGTPRYMAPELAALANGRSSGYGIAVDWWALGCVVYKMATGETPFEGSTDHRRIDLIISSILSFGDRYRVVGRETPERIQERRQDVRLKMLNAQAIQAIPGSSSKPWSHFADFVAALLNPNAFFRLGGGSISGPRTVLLHPFFSAHPAADLERVDWDALQERQLQPPLVPKKEDLIVDVSTLRRIASGRASASREGRRISQMSVSSVSDGQRGRVGLAQATQNMNNISVKTFHSELSELDRVVEEQNEMEEAGEREVKAAESQQKKKSGRNRKLQAKLLQSGDSGPANNCDANTLEQDLREKLELDVFSFLGSSLVRKRVVRQQNMLQNQRKAKILSLKRSTAVTGSLAPAVLRRAAVAEAIHQMLLSETEKETQEEFLDIVQDVDL